MYCSSCGAAATPNSTFCNRCGAELGAKKGLREASLDSLVWAMACVTIVGLGALIGLMAVMKEVLHFNDGLIIAFSLLWFLAFLGVDSAFVWLLVRTKNGERSALEISADRWRFKKGEGEDQARALPEPALSVTEHTTRRIEHAREEEQ